MLITINGFFFVGDYGLERVDLGIYVKYVEFFAEANTAFAKAGANGAASAPSSFATGGDLDSGADCTKTAGGGGGKGGGYGSG